MRPSQLRFDKAVVQKHVVPYLRLCCDAPPLLSELRPQQRLNAILLAKVLQEAGSFVPPVVKA